MSRQRSFPVDFIGGKWFWCPETLLHNGWIVLTGADITSLKQTERELTVAHDSALMLSRVDELTGVPNRRFALSNLGSFLNGLGREMTDFSVASLDLDHFKSINDTSGHEAGDLVLRQFAKHCVSCVCRLDLVGRLGGEEFVILFHGVSADNAQAMLGSILVTVPPVTVKDCELATITVAFSAGVTQASYKERPEEVLAHADNALHAAKHAGRSCVKVILDVVSGTVSETLRSV